MDRILELLDRVPGRRNPSASMERNLEVLRQNDPSVTSIDMYWELNNDAIIIRPFLEQALRTNEHDVTKINLFLEGSANNNNWDLMHHFIAARENLEGFSLICLRFNNLPDRVPQYLLAIQQNTNIKTVQFRRLRLSGDLLAAFLDTATFLQAVTLDECSMQFPAQEGAIAVAAALQRNANIQQLKLKGLSDNILIPILNSLSSNASVAELELALDTSSEEVSLAESLAIKDLFGVYNGHPSIQVKS
jgi:hypothetical protein